MGSNSDNDFLKIIFLLLFLVDEERERERERERGGEREDPNTTKSGTLMAQQ